MAANESPNLHDFNRFLHEVYERLLHGDSLDCRVRLFVAGSFRCVTAVRGNYQCPPGFAQNSPVENRSGLADSH
ncbi:MAG: hypothetical protein QE485_13650 [Acidovorax sp.]|uniref:hypothetical protein n=1 Tax=Acidovorax sp. TaxID=1872122 RepID=UPI002637C4BE|nr:hypothetical protein [Acidovorax sp.]MDH4418262.1 hypothetical protein [Acidovorax sp.]